MALLLNTKNKILLAAIFSLTIVFLIDIYLPLGFATGTLYLFCLVIVSNLSKRTILIFGSLAIFLSLFKLFLFYKSGETSSFAIPNRLITFTSLTICTWLLLLRKHSAISEKKTKKINLKLLKEQNNKLEELQKAIDSHLTISVTDINGKIIFANKNFCNLYKYSLKEIIGKTHSIVNSGFHSREFFNEMWNTMLDGKIWVGEIKNKTKSGEYYWSETVNIPIKDKNGKILKFLCTRRDITENVYLKEKSIKEKKDLEHFTYIATHDLKSPVLNLELLLDNLQLENSFSVDSQFLMNNIVISVKKIHQTIESLNEVIKHKKNINDTIEELSLKDEFEIILKSIEQNIKNKNISVNYDFSDNPTIHFSKIQLHSLFQNFLTNSIKYRRKNIDTIIQITSRCVGNKIQLIFEDNGMGIDLDKQKENLYGLFKRFHNTNEEGKGIGLHIVKHIVDNNNGSIEVQSELNKGTTFILSFKSLKMDALDLCLN
jgi:PAS domain S-box-containing protein